MVPPSGQLLGAPRQALGLPGLGSLPTPVILPAIALERGEAPVVIQLEQCYRGDPASQPALAALHSALHQEIEAFCLQVLGEMRARKPYQLAAISKVNKAMQVLWPRSRISVFGSNATGLALPSSDVDILVHLPPVRNLEPIKEAGILEGRNGIKETCLQHAARYLADQDWVKSETIKTVENAMVPIVMLTARLPEKVRRLGSGGSQYSEGPAVEPEELVALPGYHHLSSSVDGETLALGPTSSSTSESSQATMPRSSCRQSGPLADGRALGSNALAENQAPESTNLPTGSWGNLGQGEEEGRSGCPAALPPRGPWGVPEDRRLVRLDISFEGGSHSGLRTAELIRELTAQFPAMPPLLLVLKQFLTDRSLDHPFTGGLSTYCLVLLITRFLQDQPHIGRPLQWQNLGSLLLDFLHFFGCIFDPRRMCSSVRQGGMYLQRTQSIDPLSIEDPLDPSNNVGRNCFRILQCTKAFADAYALLESQLPAVEAAIQDGSPLCGTQLLARILPSMVPA